MLAAERPSGPLTVGVRRSGPIPTSSLRPHFQSPELNGSAGLAWTWINEKPPVSSGDIGGSRLNRIAGDRDRTGDIQLGNARAADRNPRESGHFRRTPRSLAHGLAQGRA